MMPIASPIQADSSYTCPNCCHITRYPGEVAAQYCVNCDTFAHELTGIHAMDQTELPDTAEAAVAEIEMIVNQIKPFLAGRNSGLQGLVLARLVSLWLAGHRAGGESLVDRLLSLHVEMVRNLLTD